MVAETLKKIGKKMKKLSKFMYGLIYFCHSCASTNPSSDFSYQGWSLLEEARSLDCEFWEKTSNELEIKELTPMTYGDKFSYFVKSRDRKGKFLRYIAYSDDGLEVDNRLSLSWGADDRYLQDFMLAGQSVIVMQRKKNQGETSIEIRDSKKNIVIASSKPMPANFEAVAAAYDDKWLWVAYRLDSEDIASVDQDIFIAKFTISNESLEKIQTLKLNLSGEIVMLRSEALKQAFAIIRDAHTERDQSGRRFSFINLTESKGNKPQMKTLVKASDKVESWGAVFHGESLYLAFVSGDTLLWNNAKLNMTSYNYQGIKHQETSLDIDRIHVGDVRLISHVRGPIAVMPQWLEGESTVGFYSLVDGSLKSMGVYGVFIQGTEFFGAFSYMNDRNVILLNRSNESFAKKYSVCNVEL
jgi:hypothetical protein